MIYLDHAATAYPRPKAVLEALQASQFGNPGRSGHGPGLDASRTIFETRLKLAEVLNVDSEDRLIFTSGATVSLNMALLGMLPTKGMVCSTNLEHNAVARVLKHAETTTDLKWTCLDAVAGNFDQQLKLKLESGEKPALVVMNHVSNVTGVRQNLIEVRGLCQKYKVPLIIDAAQSMGHEPIELKENEVICFSAHKGYMGPTGVGVMAIGENIKIVPIFHGGTGSNSESLEMPNTFPDVFEVGTPNVSGIHAFRYALEAHGSLNESSEKMQQLRSTLITQLKEIKEVKVFSPLVGGSAVSIDVPDHDIGQLAHRLWERYQICCRIGLHCAPLAHQALGTYPNGTMRISLGLTTTENEIAGFMKALKAEI